MKTKFTKRLLSWVMAAAMVISMLPISAMASEAGSDPVARIGEHTYETLDEALQAASVNTKGDDVTIELLADATTKGWQQNRNLTIKAAEGLTQKPKITFDTEGLALWGVALEFENIDVAMNGIGATPYVEWKWMAICASVNASLTLDNVNMTMDATGASGSPHAIYFCQNNVLNVKNGSNLTIKNYANDALEWDGGNGGYNVNITDSTFVSDHNRSGFTGTFYATITNSDVDVINSTGNGSNGSHFIIDNSTVDFSDNADHGLSATNLTIKNHSVVTANHNGRRGVSVNDNGNLDMDGTSVMTVTENSWNYDESGLKLRPGANGKVEKGAVVTITDNYCSGLSNNGTCVFEEGVDLTIMNNDNKQGGDTGSHGGGVYNYGANAKLTLPSDAVIYNNHALTDGDDIYNNLGTITFGKVDPTWVLDDCDHLIDGWYDDAENARWAVHPEGDTDSVLDESAMHAVEFEEFDENGLATVTGPKALKAAHGKDPVDKTSYPGLDKQVGDDDEPMNNDDVDAAAGQEVNFKLTSNVPNDLLNYIIPDVDEPEIVTPAAANALVPVEDRGEYHLTFHDQMVEGLVSNNDFTVFLDSNKNGVLDDGEKVLTSPNDYTISENVPHTDEDGTVTGTCDFEITMDLVALYEADVIKDADIEAATPIVVTYSAKLSDTATAGSYENKAWTTVDENDWESSPDTVEVNTYKLSIFKYDQATDEALPGATFTLYNDEDCADEHIVATDLSENDGFASFDGLDAGTYYLKETEAPEGYVCSDKVVTIIIGEDGQQDAENIVNVRFANSQIPHTGGMGTTLFSIVGGALIATAGVIFVISRKKRARSAA